MVQAPIENILLIDFPKDYHLTGKLSFIITKKFIHFFIAKFFNLFFSVNFTQIQLAVSGEDAFEELLSF